MDAEEKRIEHAKLLLDEWKFRSNDLWKQIILFFVVTFFIIVFPEIADMLFGTNKIKLPPQAFRSVGAAIAFIVGAYNLSNSFKTSYVRYLYFEIQPNRTPKAYLEYSTKVETERGWKIRKAIKERFLKIKVTPWMIVVMYFALFALGIVLIVHDCLIG